VRCANASGDKNTSRIFSRPQRSTIACANIRGDSAFLYEFAVGDHATKRGHPEEAERPKDLSRC